MPNSSWPIADRPSAATVRTRQRVVEAGADGDLVAVRSHLAHRDDRVRATALVTVHQHDVLSSTEIAAAALDGSPRVRRALAMVGATDATVDLSTLIRDSDASVAEAACWSAGERGHDARILVGLLSSVSADHAEPLCREAAVAALGAIGDESGLPAILAATGDRATVRRRAVLALAPFDNPRVTAALERALQDRDWQVRQAAEDLLTAVQ